MISFGVPFNAGLTKTQHMRVLTQGRQICAPCAWSNLRVSLSNNTTGGLSQLRFVATNPHTHFLRVFFEATLLKVRFLKGTPRRPVSRLAASVPLRPEWDKPVAHQVVRRKRNKSLFAESSTVVKTEAGVSMTLKKWGHYPK